MHATAANEPGDRPAQVRWFEDLDRQDVAQVGGKNASLGEMIRELRSEGVRVPGGFATTAAAYRAYVEHNGLADRLAALAGAGNDQEREEQAGPARATATAARSR